MVRSMLLQGWIHIFGYSNNNASQQHNIVGTVPSHRIPFEIVNPSIMSLQFEEVRLMVVLIFNL